MPKYESNYKIIFSNHNEGAISTINEWNQIINKNRKINIDILLFKKDFNQKSFFHSEYFIRENNEVVIC